MFRKEDIYWVKKCMEYEVEGSRPRGRPKRTWREVVQKVCQARKWNCTCYPLYHDSSCRQYKCVVEVVLRAKRLFDCDFQEFEVSEEKQLMRFVRLSCAAALTMNLLYALAYTAR